ncbi:MAG: hypothetical protein AYK18_02925 [Theionarchaea archaeon DG-70]|nr:MAG: hypothetical protein AYK18_02925 [Theionarchaea archaeon DG-70]
MGKIGNFQYPNLRLNQAIGIIDIIVHNYKGEISLDGLSQELKMKKTGGGFISKVSSLKLYGLITGKSKLTVTDIGKTILLSPVPDEIEKAKSKAYSNIQLFKKIFQKSSGKIPEKDRFQIILRDLTETDLMEVKAKTGKILKLYEEAAKYLKGTNEQGISEKPMSALRTEIPSEEFIDARVGDVYVKFPRKEQSISIARKLIDMMEEQLEFKKKTPPKEEKTESVRKALKEEMG